MSLDLFSLQLQISFHASFNFVAALGSFLVAVGSNNFRNEMRNEWRIEQDCNIFAVSSSEYLRITIWSIAFIFPESGCVSSFDLQYRKQ
jgi:hypothetical protein